MFSSIHGYLMTLIVMSVVSILTKGVQLVGARSIDKRVEHATYIAISALFFWWELHLLQFAPS